MNHEKTLHFNPPPGLHKDNDPQGANSARARIAGLPSQYHPTPMPSKEQVAKEHKPVSPAAHAVPKTRQLTDLGGIVPHKKHPHPHQAHSTHEPKTVIDEPAEPKKKRRLPGHLAPLATGIITFVLLFTLFKSPIILSQLDYFTKKPASEPVQSLVTVPPDPIIQIPKINVSAPVVYISTNAEAAIQKGLEGGVVHYAGTALPGQKGNAVIVGHSSNDWWEPGNYKFVFVLLDKLVVGDTFTVNYSSIHYVYEVTETKVVEPTDLSVLRATSDPTITLITCTPPGTAWKRLIIKAKQTSPGAAQVAAAQNDNFQSVGDLPGESKGITGALSGLWNSLVNLFTNEAPAKPDSGALPGA